MDLNERAQLENELLISMQKLKEADNIIKNLTNNKFAGKKNQNEIKLSIEDLKLTHKLCVEDIKNHNETIKKLKNKLDEGERIINKLKQENEKLTKIHQKKDNDKFNKNLHIKNTIQLSQFLGFKSKKSGEIGKDHGIGGQKKNLEKNKINNEIYLKKKADLEKKFQELKEKSNRFNETIEDQNKIINEYKNFLKEVNQNMNNFNEGLNISAINIANMENNEQQKKFDEIYDQIDKVSLIIVNMDDLVSNIKNNFIQNLENLLNNITVELNELNLEENQNDYNFNNISQTINSEFNEIEKIFEKFWKDNNNFYEINNNVEEELNKLKYLYKNYVEEYKKKRENSRAILMQEDKNKINEGKILNNYNNYFNSNDKSETSISDSFVFKLKGFNSKEDLYKTINIFKETEEDYLIEQYIEDAQLLRKNYHVICYVYDNFDVYDIYYDLKAVGLRRAECFTKSSHPFHYGKDIEVQSFSINGEEYPFIKRSHNIEFQINLRNLESINIHILYKSSTNKNFLTQNELNLRNIYKKEYYGLERSLAGQKAKFSLILKGSFDIVNFSKYFLVRNKKNKKEVEYIWGGIVPFEGMTTLITFSKKEATWSFNFSVELKSNSFIRDTMFYVPIEFIGGNNEIVNIKSACPQSTNCILEEEERQYAIEFFNTRYKDAKFNIEGVLKNKCKGEWEIDLTNEEIENLMPEEDRLCKEQLRTFANNIIKEFDNKNKDNNFEFHDYMKIGMWVYENITYDLSYSGQTNYSSVDIYNMKKGVCHHFTKLSNALLYSLGYKVLYVAGYVCKDDSCFKTNTGHAWSLIRLNNNKWYPFDSTWGIFTGKLPVIHIFSCFSSKHISARGSDRIKIDNNQMEGIFIQ